MADNDCLPIFERWAARYDQSVQTDQGIFASYDSVLAEVVRAAGVETGMRSCSKWGKPRSNCSTSARRK